MQQMKPFNLTLFMKALKENSIKNEKKITHPKPVHRFPTRRKSRYDGLLAHLLQ